MKRGDTVIVKSDTSPRGGHDFDDIGTLDRFDDSHVYVVSDNGVTVGIPLLYVKRIEVAA